MAFKFKLDDFSFLETIFISALAHSPDDKERPFRVGLSELQSYRQEPINTAFSFSDKATLQAVLKLAIGNKSSFLPLDVQTKARLIARNINRPNYDLWRVPDEVKQKHGFFPSLPHHSPDEFIDLYEHFLFAWDTAETSIGNFHSIDLTDNERLTDLERGLHFFATALQTGAACGVTNLFELALTLVNKYRILIPGKLKSFYQNPVYQNLKPQIHHHYDVIKEGLRAISASTFADKLSPYVRNLLCEGIRQFLADINPQWANTFEEIQVQIDDEQIIDAFDYWISPDSGLVLQVVTEQIYTQGDPIAILPTPFAPAIMGLQTLAH